MKTITKEEFERKGKEWTETNREYDTEFQSFFSKVETVSLEDSDFANMEEFREASSALVVRDAAYDNLFQDFLNNPKPQTTEELAKFKEMQEQLYPLEDRLYKVAGKFFSLEEIQALKAKQERLLEIEQDLFRVAEGKMIIKN